jgi:hypothetical protein
MLYKYTDVKLLIGVIILHFKLTCCIEIMYNIFEDKLKIVPPNNLNKYLYNGKSEIKVNINTGYST